MGKTAGKTGSLFFRDKLQRSREKNAAKEIAFHDDTLQSVLMSSVSTLNPTLWRTCRVLANRGRLEMFRLLIREPGLSVSAVAEHVHCTLPVASQYLRALEARGLLVARRNGRHVNYRPSPPGSSHPSAGLVVALRQTFKQVPAPVAQVFRLATAFTHPSRVLIYRLLQVEPQPLAAICTACHSSAWATMRHLQKLENRGFVHEKQERYVVTHRRDPLGRELARLAGA